MFYDDALLGHFYWKADWKEQFAWWPQRCTKSGRRIWLEQAYRGTAVYTGPGEPAYEHHWHTKEEHLLWLLTQPVK